MIWLAIWAAVGLLGGILMLVFLPWSAARMAGGELQDTIANKYVYFAQTCATKTAIIARPGSLKLVGKRWDSDFGQDKDTAQGDPRHHGDGFNALSRLANKPFAFGLQSAGEYVSPLLAEIGDKARRARDNGDVGEEQGVMKDGYLIPKRSKLVDITDSQYLPTGSCEPEEPYQDYQKTKISQEKFHERISFGQTMILLIAAIGSMVAMWFLTGQDTPDAGGTTLSMLLLIGAAGQWLEDSDLDWAKIGVSLYAIAFIASLPLIAWITYSIIHAIVVLVVMVSVAVTVPVGITLLGPSIPLFMGLPMARLCWIMAQLSVGRGVIVERADGSYEYHKLEEAESDEYGFQTTLSDGKTLEIDGSTGDLFRFGWAPLGMTAEKTSRNMGRISEEPPEQMAADGGKIQTASTREGYKAVLPIPDENEWLVTGPQLWTLCRKTAESEAIERGRNKALTEHGGTQQISMTWFMGAVLMAILIGSSMGFVAAGGL